MKQMGKFLSIFIFTISFFCLFQSVEVYATTDYVTTDNEDGTVTIIDYNGSVQDIIIPSTIDGKIVTGIGEYAFYNKSLTSVTIPDSVTSVLLGAFAKNNLSTVEIKSKDTNINSYAFSQQYQRESCDWYVSSDFSGEKFDFSAQRDDNITLYLYDKCIVTYDTNGADAEVPSDKTAKINSKVTKPIDPTKTGYIFIGWYKDNRLIEEWDFLTNVVTKDITLYAGWISEPEILTDDDVEVVGGEIKKYLGSKTNIIIPSTLDGQTVTSIGDNAFKEKNLTGVIIPGSVKRIGKYAFSFNSLRRVTISNGVEEIGERAFLGGKFKSITIPDSVTSIGVRAFESNQLTSITIPNNIKKIEEGTFIGNSFLTCVTIPNSVTSIGVEAFAMTRLTSIKIPNSVINIEEKAFIQSKLTSVTIPSSVTTIGIDAFGYNKLTTVTIESIDAMIHPKAFECQVPPNNELVSDWYENPDLSGSKFVSWGKDTRTGEITIYSYAEITKHTVIFNTNGAESVTPSAIKVENNNTISEPENPTKAGYSFGGWYKDSELKNNWDFSADVVTEDITLYAKWLDSRILTDDEVVVTDGIITSYTGTKTDIIIPSTLDGQTVIGIGNEVFIGKKLTNVTIPSNVESIGNNAFESNKLTSVIIPNSVTEIANDAFAYNILKSVTIGNGVTYIGNSAFKENKLTNVTIPDRVEIIGGNAFANNQLANVTIPDNVTQIQECAFKSNKLTSVIISNGLGIIGESVFEDNCLTSVTIPDNVKTIRECAFKGNQLTSVTIGNGVTEIMESAFQGNEKLGSTLEGNQITSLTIPDSVESIGNTAFAFNKLKSVTIPKNVKVISGFAFFQNHLTSVTIKSANTEIDLYAFECNDSGIVPEGYKSQILPNDFEFKGWFKSPELTDDSKFDSWGQGTRTGDLTIYSYFEIKQHTVSFNTNGAESGELSDITVENNKTILKPENLTKTGYKIDGWYKDSELTIEWDFLSDVVTEDITLFAKWLDSRILTDDEVVVTDGVITSYTGTKTDIIIPSTLDGQTVIGIGNNAFTAKNLTSVEIPNSVTSMGEGAFFQNQLTSLEIPYGVTRIGECAFASNSLTSLEIPNSVTSIGEEAFVGNLLTSVIIPDSLTNIEDSIFEDNKLKSVVIPDSITNIGSSAFEENELTNIIIPDSVETIEDYAFISNKLTSVTIPENVKRIDEFAFFQNHLTSVTIKNKDTEINLYAFECNNPEVVPPEYKSQILPNDFEFKGWFKSPELTDDSKFDSWGQGTRTGDLTIYSYFEIKQHNVTFNTDEADSVTPSSIKVENNNTISKPENPTKTGYSFDGWYKDSKLTTNWDFSSDVVTEDIILYAKWTTNPKVDTPKVSPDGGNFTNSLQAVLICTTTDVCIHFTLDGSEPTTESEVYTSPITINQTTTLKAMATALGYQNSDILTVTYTKKSSSNSTNNNTVKGKADDTSFNVGTKKIKRNNKGEKEIIVTTKESAIKKQVDKINEGDEISIPAVGKANIAKIELNVQSIKDMQDKDLTLEVKTNEAIYNLTTNKINIDNISDEIGEKVKLKDIKFAVQISKTNKDMVKVVKNSANGNGLSVVVPPVDFVIEASYNNKTYKVNRFKGFVSRKIEIPEGVDASKITTAIVIDKDGSIRHVPTFVTIIDGKYYAEINSLTNSTYTLIYNKEVFSDVTDNHWAKVYIEKMASRIVVEGKEDGTFCPDEAITRGELVKAIVRALGLKPIVIDKFDDINSDSEIAGYIGTAYSYGIIKGINEDTFDADGLVTRQDAMTMIYRASKIADFIDIDKDKTKEMSCYIDYKKISDYAKEAIYWNVVNSIIIGKTDDTIGPFDNITRAELCAIINRFLISAGLIN